MSPSAETRQAAYLTLGVWVAWAILYVLPVQLFEEPIKASSAISLAIVATVGVVFSGFVFETARRVRDTKPLTKVAVISAAAVGASVLLAIVDGLSNAVVLRLLDMEPVVEPDVRLVRNAAAFVWKFAVLGALYAVLEGNRVGRERERLLAEAQSAASAARLAALRYQLNPHFLFNTLNAISSLVVTKRVREGEAMLTKLSEFLRATLSADPEGETTVEEELGTLQHYLEIESVRFRDRLEVEFVCPPDLDDALVPSFILQPLIENSIKYAVSPTRRPVAIRVEAARDGGDLVIVVEDDGDAAEAAAARPGTGVGLANVRQRLETLFGQRGSLETVRRERGFLAIVRLPFERRIATIARVA